MLSFTRETDDDIVSIRQVVTTAFGDMKVAELVETIRNSTNFIPELSLVAVENGDVLGHILFSRLVIEAQEQTVPALALAPLAVTPMRQRQALSWLLVSRTIMGALVSREPADSACTHPCHFPMKCLWCWNSNLVL